MIKSNPQLDTKLGIECMPRGLANWEVSQIKEAIKTIEGWKAEVFDCECCGQTTARVVRECEATDGLQLEISRDGSRISLTTTLPDGEEYVCEFSSVAAALGGVRVTITSATDPLLKHTRKLAIAA
jgi:hypothetical protein